MLRTEFISTGMYVPERVVTNHELEGYMDTSDEWIRQRSGIEERRWAAEDEGGSDMAKVAAERALQAAGMGVEEIDCIIVATLSPDPFLPGHRGLPAAQARNHRHSLPRHQKSVYRVHLRSRDRQCLHQVRQVPAHPPRRHRGPLGGHRLSTEGRDTAVLFGDGAAVAILGPTEIRTAAFWPPARTPMGGTPRSCGPRLPPASASRSSPLE